jgi:hypothetical protein
MSSLTSKLKEMSKPELGSFAFYIVSGILFLALLFITTFPPHLLALGILSIITGYSVLTKRSWAVYLIVINLVTATVFALWTAVNVGSSNWLTTLSLIAYLILTWLVTIYLTIFKKSS